MSGIRIFALAGIPVFVSPWYMVLLLYYGWRLQSAQAAISFIVAVTLGLLIHEFGHAGVSRHYKLNPRVLLHGFGGLCYHDRAQRDLHDVFIIVAGPGLGILSAVLVLGVEFGLRAAAPQLFTQYPVLDRFLSDFWWVSFIWNFVNFIPLWPLDGGQLFRLGAVKLLGARRGEQVTHIVGIALAIAGALAALQFTGGLLLPLLCGFLAWENINHLTSGRASGPVRTTNRFAQELYNKARKHLEEGDWREAARLGHQIRAESSVPDALLDKVWELLAIATTQLGDHEDALSFIRRAPRSPQVVESEIRCLAHLGRHREAREVMASPQAARLPEATRQQLLDLIKDNTQGAA